MHPSFRRARSLVCAVILSFAPLASDAASSPAVGSGVTHADIVLAAADGRSDWRPPRVRTPAAALPDDAHVPNAPPVLGRIGPQRLVAGRRWRLRVRARDTDGEAPHVFVRGLPEGARFDRIGGGWHVLDWTPPADFEGSVDLTVGAIDTRDRRLRVERVVRVEVTSRTRPPVQLTAPHIVPVSTQIVSVGRAISFRIVSSLDDGRAPLVHIDRLPRNASFDENSDGSRTFHWPTGQNDQGEHRFRITARHPDDEALQSRIETLVIVGDPSYGTTRPLDPDGSVSAEPPTFRPPLTTEYASPSVRELPAWYEDDGTSDPEYFEDDHDSSPGFPDDPTDFLPPESDGMPGYEADYFDDDGDVLFDEYGSPIDTLPSD